MDEAKRAVIESYARKTPAELEQLVTEYDQRQAFISANLTADAVLAIFAPFMERIKVARTSSALGTQCVTLLLASTQALARRIQNPATDEAIIDLFYEPLAGNEALLRGSATARAALASNGATTVLCIATYLPISMLPGMGNNGQNASMTHSVTGIRIK